MINLADELLAYFNSTPKDKVKEEWESIHKQFSYGVKADSYIASLKEMVSFNEAKEEELVFEHVVEESYRTNEDMSMAA